MRVRLSLVALFTVVVVSAPFLVRAATNEELLNEIAQLLAQVQLLQARLQAVESAPGTSTNPVQTGVGVVGVQSCVALTQNLSRGMENEEVRALQAFLARDPSVYPEAIVSGFYGRLTELAVQRWQEKHAVVTSGTPSTTGYGVVGPKTRAAMQQSCTGATFNPVVARDLVVTPLSGPLPTQVTATFSLNGSSCSSFILDWGDGTPPLSFDAGDSGGICTRDIAHKQATHTYTLTGRHTVTLSAVQGPLAAAQFVSQHVVSIGEQVPGTFAVHPTSGSAPLTTSITFPVEGSTCTSYVADWGDGVVDQHEALSAVCSADSGTQSLTHTYTQPGTYTVLFKSGQGPVASLQHEQTANIEVRDDVFTEAAVDVLPTSGVAPLQVLVRLHARGETCGSYLVDWGDGTEGVANDATQELCTDEFFTKEFTHTYIAPGVYTLTTALGQDQLSKVPRTTQNIVVTATPTIACHSNAPVCGEVTNTCPAGFTCNPVYQTFQNVCAMQQSGAALAHPAQCN